MVARGDNPYGLCIERGRMKMPRILIPVETEREVEAEA